MWQVEDQTYSAESLLIIYGYHITAWALQQVTKDGSFWRNKKGKQW